MRSTTFACLASLLGGYFMLADGDLATGNTPNVLGEAYISSGTRQ